jgi:hypothetical protein
LVECPEAGNDKPARPKMIGHWGLDAQRSGSASR